MTAALVAASVSCALAGLVHLVSVIGGRPQGFWAELERAILNPYQARAQYCADAIGIGFAQGMFRSNPILNSSRLRDIH